MMVHIKKVLLTGFLTLSFFPLIVQAEVDCTTLPHWIELDNGLQMNQKHLFCGEWKRSRAKGFHSRPSGENPATVAKFTIQDQPNKAGIYTGRWSYQNHTDKNKFSSMFPDNCSIEQVLNSISYASSNTDTNCPKGSPNWTKCGSNTSTIIQKDATKYCSVNGEHFTIGYAPPQNGKINTAFPIYK